MSWPRSLLLTAMKVGFVLLLSLLCAEVMLHLLLRPSRAERTFWAGFRRLHRPTGSPKTLYALAPGAREVLDHGALWGGKRPIVYAIAPPGIRGESPEVPKPAETFRILVLGDSVTFGFGVAQEDTYPRRLEQALQARFPDRRVEVINAGVGGYSIYNETGWMEEYGMSLAPDAVLVGFCMNDVDDPYFHFSHHTLETLGALPPAAIPDPARMRPPTLWSRLYLPRLTIVLLDLLRGEGGEGHRLYEEAVQALSDPASPQWVWLRERYGELSARLDRAGIPFGVLLFPLAYQIAPQNLHPEPFGLLSSYFREEGIPALDLRSAFRGGKSSEFFLDVTHLSETGHARSAQAVASWMIRELLSGKGGRDRCAPPPPSY
ncbi:MAG: SGNH/GDSL hydrolase family protein [Deltaproteobacteria bacterium]|nr:MAG: SGNH/GDSL hydrolase family protein [Deltaproteobacteria bacterium]